ncbi:hypothetical protein B0H11DRAFT_2056602 [Mycena galericulata]|nr:hypothetical protein B0H11DRAFT_2056602 [Mycena galericulata]
MLVSHPVERLIFILPLMRFACNVLSLALKSFPQTAPLTPALKWVSAGAMQGAVVIALIPPFHYLVWFVLNARRWLTHGRTTSTSSPTELENGTGSPDLSALAAEETIASAGIEKDSDATPDTTNTIPKLVTFFSNPAIIFIILFTANTQVESRNKPLPKNVGSTLTHLRRGFVVMVVAYLLLGAVEWSRRVVLGRPRDVEVPDASADKDMRAAEARNLEKA